jgi:hypothetical protein
MLKNKNKSVAQMAVLLAVLLGHSIATMAQTSEGNNGGWPAL